MNVKLGALMVGVASFVPGLQKLTARQTGGTNSARYCYAVWMRHLLSLRASGLPTRFGAVAELGPGDSLGVGIAALLSSADRYVALDVIRYSDPARNIQILDELVTLFRARAPVPNENEFPRVHPPLLDYTFPHDLMTANGLDRLLDSRRLALLRKALRAGSADPDTSGPIRYLAPWTASSLPEASVDLILSQSVLQYTLDLHETYAVMRRWLRPGGVMSHEVDFKSIGRTQAWNGHWACSDLAWALMQGRRRNPLNRAPISAHTGAQAALGLEIVCQHRKVQRSEIPRSRLARRFADLSDVDLTTASALIQSRMPVDASLRTAPASPRVMTH